MTADKLEQVKASLERVQTFDPQSLKRESDLGQLHFGEAIEPAKKVVDLFRQIPKDFLDELPENQLNTIQKQADESFNITKEILEFTPKQENPQNVHSQLLSKINAQYQNKFGNLITLISYCASRQRDVEDLESKFRSSLQQAQDRTDELMAELEKYREQAQHVLDEVRHVAMEQGVSQQAIYFDNESKIHDAESDRWRGRTISIASFLAVLAIASLFVHKIPILAPESTCEAIQMGISKALIFASVGFLLFLSARNFLSHKHNAIINKHRQNALLTFKAFVDASQLDDRRDVVLTHAASCIFAPQETGYSRFSSSAQSEPSFNLFQSLAKFGESEK